MTAGRRRLAFVVAGAAACAVLGFWAADALAQASPFGVARPEAASVPTGGALGWIAERQSSFYRALTGALRKAKTDGSALWLLVGLSFAYGVFHAAGPGHGKAVISSYIVASGDTLRRGLALSCAGALLQAVVAVALVLTLTLALRATSLAMNKAAFGLEAVSYAVMAGLGLYLVVVKARSLVAAARGLPDPGHAHAPGEACSHGPDPGTLVGALGLRRAAAIVLAIGVRPCTGALVVLVFAAAQGLLWAGIAATLAMAVGTAITVAAIATLAVAAKAAALRLASFNPRAGTVAIRGLELFAALFVLGLGSVLLVGLLAGGTSLGG